MAESLSEVRSNLKEVNDKLAAARQEKALVRKEFEEKNKLAERAQKVAAQQLKDEKRQIQRLVKGPDTPQVGADMAAIIVGEGVFRLITWGMHKLGLQSPLWFTVPTGALGTLMYVIAYPRREEGAIRKLVRATGLYWQQVSLHDGVGYLTVSSQQKQAQIAQIMQQNQQLQQQVQGQGQQAPQGK